MTDGAVTRVVLLRHAEPEETVRGRCYGKLDVGLSEAGRQAAARAATQLARVPLAAVYSSPARRAFETAEPIARQHGLAPEPLRELRELDFGEFEGRTYDELAASEPDVYRRWMTTPTEVRFPGGESYGDLRRRVTGTFSELRARHRGQRIAVVSHGGVARAILADALAMPDSAIFRLDQRYGYASVIDWVDGVPVVRLVNGRPDDVLALDEA